MKNLPRRLLILLAALFGSLPSTAQDTVRVFVLAGQSNMEGKAKDELFEHQATDPATADEFRAYRRDDAWAERDDVFIKFFGRHGPLTIGYGSPGRTGCELAFGTYLGERLDDPVLLIKTAWGGRSLYRDFRPPSAGLPSAEKLQQELEQARERTRKQNEKRKQPRPLPTIEDIREAYGRDYRKMIEEVRAAVADCGERFGALAGKPVELAGFVWFQGWNDQYGGVETEYEQNLVHLIDDVRKDLGTHSLPVVIGVMGQNGPDPAKGAMKVIQQAQLAIAELERFRDTVRSVRTDVLHDRAAWKLYPDWKQQFEQWERTGSDHPYHYLGSARWFCSIGNAFGGAMMGMIED